MPGLSLQILSVSECTPKDLKLYLSKLSLNPAVPAVPTGVDSCSNLLSVAVINTVAKSSFRRERFIWLTDYSPLSREESQIRNSAKACSRNPHAEILLTGLLPGSHSIAFLIQPTTTYLGIMVLPMVSRVFLHQLSILKISPTYLPTDQHDETILQSRFHPLKSWVSSSQKKKKNSTHNAFNIWTFEDPPKPYIPFYPPSNTNRRWGACSFVCLSTSSRNPRQLFPFQHHWSDTMRWNTIPINSTFVLILTGSKNQFACQPSSVHGEIVLHRTSSHLSAQLEFLWFLTLNKVFWQRLALTFWDQIQEIFGPPSLCYSVTSEPRDAPSFCCRIL